MRSAFVCQLPGGLSHWKTIWLYSSALHKLHKVWLEGVQRLGLLLSPWLMLHREKSSTQERLHLQFGRMSQHRDPDDWLFSSLPEPQTQDFPHATLVCSAFPLPEPRVSGYKWNFECWPFKREPVSLANSCFLLGDRMLLFTARCYVCTSSHLWCSGLDSLAWGLDPTLLRENPSGFRYLSRTWASTGRSGASFLHVSALTTNLGDVVSSVYSGL